MPNRRRMNNEVSYHTTVGRSLLVFIKFVSNAITIYTNM
jgi:hypothetical protein